MRASTIFKKKKKNFSYRPMCMKWAEASSFFWVDLFWARGGVSFFFGSLSNFRAWNCPKNAFDFFRGSLIRRNATSKKNSFYPNQAENLLPPTPFSGGQWSRRKQQKKPSSLYPPTPSSGRVQMLPSSPIPWPRQTAHV